jgi:hypothetical protein
VLLQSPLQTALPWPEMLNSRHAATASHSGMKRVSTLSITGWDWLEGQAVCGVTSSMRCMG